MADNISSSALFHFTRSMTNLKSILKKGFFPRECHEYTLEAGDRKAASRKRRPLHAVPMVCLCDLPLSLIHKHMREYGSYGIGLTKEWGLKHGFAPVIYTHPKAQTHQPVRRLITQAQKRNDKGMANDLATLTAYTKPWRGPAWRNKKLKPNVQFYDEREWRYVPPNSSGKHSPLLIHPNFIRYLILPPDETEDNVLELHEHLRGIYKSNKDAILVTTTIMTEDCISEDI
jgi:hypothetical protein